MKAFSSWVLLALVCLQFGGCKQDTSGDGGSSSDAPTVAFVTNQIADFWNISKAGCEDAQKDFGINVEVRMPPVATTVEQKRIVEDLLNKGVKGIAISPLDADNQKAWINELAGRVPLITHDSDAPGTDRLLYIGMDNYRAGRMCGELVKEALPDGGDVVLFIGRLEQDNSKHRRQGVIDELLDRSEDRTRFDPVVGKIKGEKYTILATITDQGQPDLALSKAADAINSRPNMKAMVGLFEYNPPACIQALKQANKLGTIKLIGFDENSETLQGIKDGYVTGTVVQNPYQYGYRSVEVLSKLIEGDDSVIPESKYIDVPPRKITKENVDEYWTKLNMQLGK
ncbi:MAG: sugar ABC transporter substrate-binding protein [Planctomycetota bacterium]|nr:MAG: sugar ABC transporter substrate-binding protein [Planctomycetota bacterium]REJ91204.1 MAG: sugar ABC transporter substrate-binding protein [Planctomycetota bacterium]REK22205.1 MAG: sugar ABC transporter substrate-binding protein [Planctomycetota bacterium]REK44273.1 MAG: sugar ABC transporter substrate-binding protein [Planctomycetota bacterium]